MSSAGGTIYAIGSTTFPGVKIGKTSGPVAKRLATLQISSPARLELHAAVCVEAELDRLEKAIHQLLHADRLQGEWFAVTMDQQRLEAIVSQALEVLHTIEALRPGTPINPRIGERVQLARRRVGWNQKALADKAGVSFAVISRLETGHQSVSAERLAVIARLLGLSLDYVCREGDDREEDPR